MQRRLKIRTRRVIGKLIGKLSNLLILASRRYRSKAIAFEKIMFAFEERSRRFTIASAICVPRASRKGLA